MDILLIIPPFTQLNTAYPSTASLVGFLKEKGFSITQRDLSLDLLLKIYSKEGLLNIFELIETEGIDLSENAAFIVENKAFYLSTIHNVINFLQHKDSTLAYRICNRNFLPEASRFAGAEDLEWAFGSMGTSDMARHLCTLYLEDISDLIQECIDPDFGLSRYAESLALSAETFDGLHEKLQSDNSLIDEYMLEIIERYIQEEQPKIVGFSAPFPGNVYASLKCGKYLKEKYRHIVSIFGGGFANTELRNLSEKRVFQYIDYICLDDGERPLLHIAERVLNKKTIPLIRTYQLLDNQLTYDHDSYMPDFSHSEIGTPDYSGLSLNNYLSVIEIANPMHRLWSDGRWNKLQIAHGCYWGNCTFCDTTLDYIKRFSTASAGEICDRIEKIIAQTGQTGFHFVDEAAPPKLLKELSIELIERDINISWWANIRFEEYFTHDMCELLSAAGCIAVSGGVEVASERVLKLINKGVTLEKLSQVTNNFSQNGIMVHAYLMYGFPTQTAQETIDSLEVVRQLFENECIHSAFWHKFVMTVHSPIGKKPNAFKVSRKDTNIRSFSNNDLQHIDDVGCNHEMFGDGLKKALFNYMHGMCFEYPLQKWFNFKIPVTSIPPNLVERYIQ